MCFISGSRREAGGVWVCSHQGDLEAGAVCTGYGKGGEVSSRRPARPGPGGDQGDSSTAFPCYRPHLQAVTKMPDFPNDLMDGSSVPPEPG